MTMPVWQIFKYLLLLYFIGRLGWSPAKCRQNMATSSLVLDQIVEAAGGTNHLSSSSMFCYTIPRVGPAVTVDKRSNWERWDAGTPHVLPADPGRRCFISNINKIGQVNFCDLMCAHARLPSETALDGSGSCRTFIALYCNLRRSIVPKNMPCSRKKVRSEPPV